MGRRRGDAVDGLVASMSDWLIKKPAPAPTAVLGRLSPSAVPGPRWSKAGISMLLLPIVKSTIARRGQDQGLCDAQPAERVREQESSATQILRPFGPLCFLSSACPACARSGPTTRTQQKVQKSSDFFAHVFFIFGSCTVTACMTNNNEDRLLSKGVVSFHGARVECGRLVEGHAQARQVSSVMLGMECAMRARGRARSPRLQRCSSS